MSLYPQPGGASLPPLPDSETVQCGDATYTRPHSEDSVVNTLINEANPAQPPTGHLSVESLRSPAGLSQTTLSSLSHSPSHPRGSILGEIPTQTFGPASTYAFEQPSSAPGELAHVEERRVGHISRRIHGWTWQAVCFIFIVYYITTY